MNGTWGKFTSMMYVRSTKHFKPALCGQGFLWLTLNVECNVAKIYTDGIKFGRSSCWVYGRPLSEEPAHTSRGR